MPGVPLTPVAADVSRLNQVQRTDVRCYSEEGEPGSDEVQEILSVPPHAIVRGGTGSVLLALVLLVALGALIPYPETVSGRVVISRGRPPAGVVAPRSGRLVEWRTQPEAEVTNDTVLAVIESAADPEAVFALKSQLEQVAPQLHGLTAPLSLSLDPVARLGELQPAWSELVTRCEQYDALLAENHFAEKATLLTNQIATLRALMDQLPAQLHLLEREHDLVRRDYERQQALFREGLMSTSQLAEAEGTLLVKERECAQAESTLLQSRAQAIESEKALADLHRQRRDELRTARQARELAFTGLRSQIAVWEAQHVLRAPVDGTVACFKFWSAQQHVVAGEEVMTIIPADTPLTGRMLLKDRGAGKVQPGQTVRIRLDDFPPLEFGTVRACVEAVSAVPREGARLVTLTFPAGMETGRGARLAGRPELHGHARVVVAEASFFERLLGALRRRSP